jgi:hypothetical protein
MIVIHVESGHTRNLLGRLMGIAERPRMLLQAGARAGRRALQRHFTRREQTPNRLGGRRTHFWRDIRESTQVGEVTDNYGLITIGRREFAQKMFGGTIVPGGGKRALTIPVSPDAHGRRARDDAGGESFERMTGFKLILIKPRHGGAFLASVRGPGRLQVEYVLVPRVDQAPDPEALPPRDELESTVAEAAEKALQAQIREGQ